MIAFLRSRSSYRVWQVILLVAVATVLGGIAGIIGVLTA